MLECGDVDVLERHVRPAEHALNGRAAQRQTLKFPDPLRRCKARDVFLLCVQLQRHVVHESELCSTATLPSILSSYASYAHVRCAGDLRQPCRRIANPGGIGQRLQKGDDIGLLLFA